MQEDPELTRLYPEGIPNRITVRTHDGATYVREVHFPRGHARNPMTDGEVIEKFNRNVGTFWTRAQAERVLACVWHLEDQPDLRELLVAMRI